MNFSDALRWLRDDAPVRLKLKRRGWHGKDMWIELQRPDERSKMTAPYIFLNIGADYRIPWTVSQADVLADDWEFTA